MGEISLIRDSMFGCPLRSKCLSSDEVKIPPRGEPGLQ
jgi:hypothetical protein